MNRVMEDAGVAVAAGPGSHGELEAIPVLLAQQATPTSVPAIRRQTEHRRVLTVLSRPTA